MEEKKKKIKKVCHLLDVIMNIGRCVSVVGAVGIVIGSGIYFIGGENAVLYAKNHGVKFTGAFRELGSYSNGVTFLFLALILIQLIIAAVMFHQGHKIFSSIFEDGIPFKQEIAKRIHTIAILTFVLCLVPRMTSDTSDLDSLVFVSGNDIVFAIIFYGLSRIFEYGCELQRESDETL